MTVSGARRCRARLKRIRRFRIWCLVWCSLDMTRRSSGTMSRRARALLTRSIKAEEPSCAQATRDMPASWTPTTPSELSTPAQVLDTPLPAEAGVESSDGVVGVQLRSEEHTSELQAR